jgi:hypothetical protein
MKFGEMTWSVFAFMVAAFLLMLLHHECEQSNYRANIAIGQCLSAGGTVDTWPSGGVTCHDIGKTPARSSSIDKSGMVIEP